MGIPYLPRPPGKRLILPGKLPVRRCPERSGGTRRPQAAAPLTGSFRGDSAPGAGGRPDGSASAVNRGVRDGGDRLAAGAGERRCGSGPRRASPNAKAAGLGRRPQRRDSPPPRAACGGTLACPTLSLAGPCAHARSPARAGRPGAPKACHLIDSEETPHHAGRAPGRDWSTARDTVQTHISVI
jgi:hypothetical protein